MQAKHLLLLLLLLLLRIKSTETARTGLKSETNSLSSGAKHCIAGLCVGCYVLPHPHCVIAPLLCHGITTFTVKHTSNSKLGELLIVFQEKFCRARCAMYT